MIFYMIIYKESSSGIAIRDQYNVISTHNHIINNINSEISFLLFVKMIPKEEMDV